MHYKQLQEEANHGNLQTLNRNDFTLKNIRGTLTKTESDHILQTGIKKHTFLTLEIQKEMDRPVPL